MEFSDLRDIVDSVYPDGMIGQAAVSNSDDCGDTLALFIFRELHDTFCEDASDSEQLQEAVRCLTTARDELDACISALSQAADNGLEGA